MNEEEAFWNAVLALLRGRTRVRTVDFEREYDDPNPWFGRRRLNEGATVRIMMDALDYERVPDPMRGVYAFLRGRYEPERNRMPAPEVVTVRPPGSDVSSLTQAQRDRLRSLIMTPIPVMSRASILREFDLPVPPNTDLPPPPTIIDDVRRAAEGLAAATERPTVLNTRAISAPTIVTADDIHEAARPGTLQHLRQSIPTQPTVATPPEPKPAEPEPSDAEIRFSMMELD